MTTPISPNKAKEELSELPNKYDAVHRIMKERNGNKLLKFLLALLIVSNILTPFLLFMSMASAINKPQKVAMLDPAGNLYLSPLKDVEQSQELRDYCVLAAANVLFSRNPKGLDFKPLSEQIYAAKALAKLENDVKAYVEDNQTKASNVRWKFEMNQIERGKSLSEGSFLSAVSGTLIEVGEFGGIIEQRPKEFELGLKMRKNGDVLTAGRFPYIVEDFNIIYK
jgi:hypothetical protein